MTSKLNYLALLIAGAVLMLALGCGEKSSDTSAASEPTMKQQVDETIGIMKSRDPSINNFFDTAYGYVVFPDVVEGAFIVGGGRGRGLVYKQGKLAGSAILTQGDIGLQAGGQAFREVIFFRDKYAYATFAASNLEFSAKATAVIVKAGAGASADYENGVAAFAMPKAGAMLKASIGGQKFKFLPLAD